jgi:hypothetical protein
VFGDYADEQQTATGLAGFVRVEGWLLERIVICSLPRLPQ